MKKKNSISRISWTKVVPPGGWKFLDAKISVFDFIISIAKKCVFSHYFTRYYNPVRSYTKYNLTPLLLREGEEKKTKKNKKNCKYNL